MDERPRPKPRTVTRARLADLDAVKTTRLRALAEAPHAFASTLAREQRLGDDEWRRRLEGGAWFLAWEGGRPVGIISAFDDPAHPRGHHLVSLWVEPAQRGTSAATELVTIVLARAAEDCATAVILWVADGNAPALRLNQRLGFVATEQHKPLPSDPAVRETLMRHDLGDFRAGPQSGGPLAGGQGAELDELGRQGDLLDDLDRAVQELGGDLAGGFGPGLSPPSARSALPEEAAARQVRMPEVGAPCAAPACRSARHQNGDVRTVFPIVRARRDERAAARAGDEIVAAADVVMDRGFTVHAPPEAVWPWLVQLGKSRAGWYFPASVERVIPRGRRAAHRIEPAWQGLRVGDVIPDSGGPGATFEVASLAAPRELVYRPHRGRTQVSWSIMLTRYWQPDRHPPASTCGCGSARCAARGWPALVANSSTSSPSPGWLPGCASASDEWRRA